MLTLTHEEAKEWPARRWQTVRQAALAVLWKGPLLGLVFAALLLTGAAAISYLSEGQTLDFGWFQIPGKAGAPSFPILSRFCLFILLTIPVLTAFLALVGTAAVVTLELDYRRLHGNTRGGEEPGDGPV
jgi:amino acid transporter